MGGFDEFTQDPYLQSKRVGAAALGVVTALIADPSVQSALVPILGLAAGPYAPVVTALLSALLAAWSKKSDPRPIRQ